MINEENEGTEVGEKGKEKRRGEISEKCRERKKTNKEREGTEVAEKGKDK
jgi:hypothetical protein